jgi:hypothetical protein
MSDGHTRVLLCLAEDDPAAYAAGRALAGALESRGATVRTVDLRAALGPAPLRRVADLLGRVSGRTLSGALAAVGGSRFGAEIAAAPPDVVVALDPIAAAAALEWRRGGRIGAPVLGVCLDLEPAAWHGVDVDRLAVADDLSAAEATGRAAGERVVVTGVPVAPEIGAAALEERAALRARFGFSAARRLVLLDARFLDHAELTAALLQVGLVASRTDVLFDAGDDAATAALLRAAAPVHALKARMFGDVPEAPLYWRAADLSVIGPAREPLARALALGVVPVMLVSEADVDAVAVGRAVEARGGLTAPGVHRLGATLELGLSEERLARARAALGPRIHPDAAGAVASLALRLAAERPAPVAPTVTRPNSVAAAGGLEEIGLGASAGRPPTAEEARARLAALEVAIGQAQRRLEESQREMERWVKRARLSASRGEAILDEAARSEADSHRRGADLARAELGRLSDEKVGLAAITSGRQARAAGEVPEAADREADYRRMEIEDELAALKNKLGKPKK